MKPVNKFIPTLRLASISVLEGVNLDRRRINVIKSTFKRKTLGYTGEVWAIADPDEEVYFDKSTKVIVSYQPGMLWELRRLEDCGFYVPPYFHVDRGHSAREFLVGSDKKYVFKARQAARSYGKHIMDYTEYCQMTNWLIKKKSGRDDIGTEELTAKYLEFNKVFNINTHGAINSIEKTRLAMVIDGRDNFIIQNFVNIDKEWRLFYFNLETPELVLMRRTGPRLDIEEDHNIFKVPLSDIPQDVVDSAHKFMSSTGSPMMCFDIFLDEDGKYGVFEVTDNWGDEGLETYFGSLPTDAWLHAMYKANPLLSVIRDTVNKELAKLDSPLDYKPKKKAVRRKKTGK